MENNMEFRIWDKVSNKWFKLAYGADANDCIYIGLNGVLFYKKGIYMHQAHLIHPERFEVSQYIGRKDSAGVKVFTGDKILSSYLLLTGEVKMVDGKYCYDIGTACPEIPSDGFTIIGNKWEGLHAAEAKAPIEPVCDSTVQQQNPDERRGNPPVIDAVKKIFKHHENYLNPPSRIFTDNGVEYRKVEESGPEMTRRAIEEMSNLSPYIRKEPLWEYKDADFEERKLRMQKQLDFSFYAGEKNTPPQPAFKPKWKHEAERIAELAHVAMKCKHSNEPPPLFLIAEINELLSWKVNTTSGKSVVEMLWGWDDYEKNDPSGKKLKELKADNPERYKQIFDRKFKDSAQ